MYKPIKREVWLCGDWPTWMASERLARLHDDVQWQYPQSVKDPSQSRSPYSSNGVTLLILLEVIPQIPLNFDELTNSWVAYTHINLYVILDFYNKWSVWIKIWTRRRKCLKSKHSQDIHYFYSFTIWKLNVPYYRYSQIKVKTLFCVFLEQILQNIYLLLNYCKVSSADFN